MTIERTTFIIIHTVEWLLSISKPPPLSLAGATGQTANDESDGFEIVNCPPISLYKARIKHACARSPPRRLFRPLRHSTGRKKCMFYMYLGKIFSY